MKLPASLCTLEQVFTEGVAQLGSCGPAAMAWQAEVLTASWLALKFPALAAIISLSFFSVFPIQKQNNKFPMYCYSSVGHKEVTALTYLDTYARCYIIYVFIFGTCTRYIVCTCYI